MKTGTASIEPNRDLDNILLVLDSKWKRAATKTLLGGHAERKEIRETNANTMDNQIECYYQDYKLILYSFREKGGFFYVIEAKEVRKEPKAYDVRVYRFDPLDNRIEETFLKGFRSDRPLEAQRDAANLFRELRDSEDIEETLNSHMAVPSK